MNISKKLIVLMTILVLVLSFGLAGCGKEQIQETAAPSNPAVRTIVDDANREHTIPVEITKVFSISPVGNILLYTLDPELLIGWNYELREGEKEYILPQYQSLPNLGGWYAKATCNIEELLKINPEIIISVGVIDDMAVSQADQIQEQVGIPVILINGELARLDKTYEFAGKLLNHEKNAGELAAYCKKVISDAQSKSKTIDPDKRVRVYYAEGAAGLETDPRGSRHVEVLEMVGGINVAEVAMKGGMGMTPVSLEQVLSWNPDVILSWNTTQGGYLDKIMTDSSWKGIAAVQNKKVYAVPSGPFNWFDRPPSVNRILGVKWLGNLLYPEIYNYDMAKETRKFYKQFYHYDLTDEELTSLLKDSGGK
ncbi:MAG: ABC transporter substrate-binding protein [Syntrophomonadaceae bacterium]|nr:ABC transporter substrate-binding protein [Syntrophomonadaceae bacterium]